MGIPKGACLSVVGMRQDGQGTPNSAKKKMCNATACFKGSCTEPLWSLLHERRCPPKTGFNSPAHVSAKAIDVPKTSVPCSPRTKFDLDVVPWEGEDLPSSIHEGFARLSRQTLETGMPELRVECLNAPYTDAGLAVVLTYMDHFSKHQQASCGFAITYDMRSIKRPTVKLIQQVARWGNTEERQERWTRLNKVCRIVIQAGWKFSMVKRCLQAFFIICPPVTDTYLIDSMDAPLKDGFYFASPASPIRVHEEKSCTSSANTANLPLDEEPSCGFDDFDGDSAHDRVGVSIGACSLTAVALTSIVFAFTVCVGAVQQLPTEL